MRCERCERPSPDTACAFCGDQDRAGRLAYRKALEITLQGWRENQLIDATTWARLAERVRLERASLLFVEAPRPVVAPEAPPVPPVPPVPRLTLPPPVDGVGREIKEIVTERLGWIVGVVLTLTGSVYLAGTVWPGLDAVARTILLTALLCGYGAGFWALGARLGSEGGARIARDWLWGITVALLPVLALATTGASLGIAGVLGSVGVVVGAGWAIRSLIHTIAPGSKGGLDVAYVLGSAALAIPALQSAAGALLVEATVLVGLWTLVKRTRGISGGAALVSAYLATFSLALAWGDPAPAFAPNLALAGAGLLYVDVVLGRWQGVRGLRMEGLFGSLAATALVFSLVLVGLTLDPLPTGFPAAGALAIGALVLTLATFLWHRPPVAHAALLLLLGLVLTIPDLFAAIVNPLRESARTALGYTQEPLPFAWYGLTLWPFLVGILALAALAPRFRHPLSARVRSQMALFAMALSALLVVGSHTHVGDLRPALLAIPAQLALWVVWPETRHRYGPTLALTALATFVVDLLLFLPDDPTLRAWMLGATALAFEGLTRALPSRAKLARVLAHLAGAASLIFVIQLDDPMRTIAKLPLLVVLVHWLRLWRHPAHGTLLLLGFMESMGRRIGIDLDHAEMVAPLLAVPLVAWAATARTTWAKALGAPAAILGALWLIPTGFAVVVTGLDGDLPMALAVALAVGVGWSLALRRGQRFLEAGEVLIGTWALSASTLCAVDQVSDGDLPIVHVVLVSLLAILHLTHTPRRFLLTVAGLTTIVVGLVADPTTWMGLAVLTLAWLVAVVLAVRSAAPLWRVLAWLGPVPLVVLLLGHTTAPWLDGALALAVVTAWAALLQVPVAATRTKGLGAVVALGSLAGWSLFVIQDLGTTPLWAPAALLVAWLVARRTIRHPVLDAAVPLALVGLVDALGGGPVSHAVAQTALAALAVTVRGTSPTTRAQLVIALVATCAALPLLEPEAAWGLSATFAVLGFLGARAVDRRLLGWGLRAALVLQIVAGPNVWLTAGALVVAAAICLRSALMEVSERRWWEGIAWSVVALVVLMQDPIVWPFPAYILLGAAFGVEAFVGRRDGPPAQWARRTSALFAVLGALQCIGGHGLFTSMPLWLTGSFFAFRFVFRKGPRDLLAAALFLDLATCAELLVFEVGEPLAYVGALGLSVLVVAHLLRGTLDPRWIAALRYAASSAILCTAFGTFLDDPARTLAMIVLSLGSMAAGSLFRIRPYLYLGGGFLFATLAVNLVRFGLDHSQFWAFYLTALGLLVLGLMVLTTVARDELRNLRALLGQRLAGWE